MRNKTAIVTGGAQGIGKVITRYLLEKGAEVAIFDIDSEAGMETYQELKSIGHVNFYQVDVSVEEEVKSNIRDIKQSFGDIHCLINNAGIHKNKPLTDLSATEFRRVIDVNLTGAFICSKYAANSLKRSQGCIINMGSTRAFMSEPNTEAYSASKGGIVSLTHALASSLAPDVRVNCISPGWIDVNPQKKQSTRKDSELSEQDHAQHLVGRVGIPEDIAAMVSFLISPEAGFITGQNFIIDGGMTKKMIYV